MSLTRRTFLAQAALAAGVAWAGGAQKAGAPRRTLAERTAAARERYARVAAFVNRRQPELRERLLADAAHALAGRLLLPGSSELSAVGNPPRWLTPQHRDEEFLWSLNRMMHWKTLLQAEALTGDRRYGARVIAELDDWIEQAVQPPLVHPDGRPNPDVATNAGPPPWRALEVGMRLFDSWPVVFEQLAGAGRLTAAQNERLAGSVAQHGRELALLSPLLWPEADHNHYFMEMLGLLGAAAYFPELPEAAAWGSQATRELQRCVEQQFTADGGHVEACPSYHNVCVVLLGRFLDLARLAGHDLPAAVPQALAASADQTLHSVRPTGDIVPWGDSTRNNQVEAALWVFRATGEAGVLQHLVALMGLSRVQADCAAHVWDLDDPEALFAEIARPPRKRDLVRFDRGNDQVMLRSAWTREAASVFYSCHSPLLPGSGHQHIDLGGFDFAAFGRTLVADPGVFTYREGEERRRFKSAEYHSVLTIDGRGPFEYVNRWRYTPQQEGRVTAVRRENEVVQVDSFHRNYAPAVCHRTLALVGGNLLLVLDLVEGLSPASTVQLHFHLDSTQVRTEGAGGELRASYPDVTLVVQPPTELKAELLPGEISDRFDVARPSTRVRLSDEGGASRRLYATFLVPSRTGTPPPLVGNVRLAVAEGTCAFEYAGKAHRVVVG